MIERGGPQQIPRPAAARPGRPAPWRDVSLELRVSPDRVRDVFSGRVGSPSPVRELGASASAVLVALYPEPDDLGVLLTRRSWDMRTHKGEISFPGGRADQGEDPHDTARREAFEEIGLDPDAVEVLGEMDHLTTVTRRAYIVPVVAWLPGKPPLIPHPGEVDAILEVPLQELMHPDAFREERWGAPPNDRPLSFFDLPGDTVWGATAAMLRRLLVDLVGLPSEALEDYDPARAGGVWLDPPPWIGDDVV